MKAALRRMAIRLRSIFHDAALSGRSPAARRSPKANRSAAAADRGEDRASYGGRKRIPAEASLAVVG